MNDLASRRIETVRRHMGRRLRVAATFELTPGSDTIACERSYFDQSAVPKAPGLS